MNQGRRIGHCWGLGCLGGDERMMVRRCGDGIGYIIHYSTQLNSFRFRIGRTQLRHLLRSSLRISTHDIMELPNFSIGHWLVCRDKKHPSSLYHILPPSPTCIPLSHSPHSNLYSLQFPFPHPHHHNQASQQHLESHEGKLIRCEVRSSAWFSVSAADRMS